MLNTKQKEALKTLTDKNKKYIKLWGGSRSGKTFQACRFTILRALRYPGSKHLIARYSYANLRKTLWIQELRPQLNTIQRAGHCHIRDHEGIVTFKNGSLLVLGGLEPIRIDAVLAAEYATIFVTEANENKYESIQMLFTRLNDISENEQGQRIDLKFLADLNPTTDRSWDSLLWKGIDPITEKPKVDYHQYADIHYNPEDNIDNLADGYIDSLKALSPSARRRFYEGTYGHYEGLIYELKDSDIVDDFEIPKEWPKGRAIDFGFIHPFVCLWIALDDSNETLYLYREHVEKGQTVRTHSQEILKQKEKYEHTVCDHDSEDRATLAENGIINIKARKEVLTGIDRVRDLLERGKLKIFRSCTNTINEFYMYRWKDNAQKEQPVKEGDDCMDALRYSVMQWFPPMGKVKGGLLWG